MRKTWQVSRPSLLFLAAVCGLAAPGARAQAQELYSVQFNLFGGAGGSLDAEPGDGFGNSALELGVLVPTEPGTLVALRAGRVEFDGAFGRYAGDAELEYAHVSGEYRFFEGYYTSGLFLGLGGYRLSGTRAGRDESEDALGLVVGVTADFPLNRHLSLGLQLTGHYVDFDDQQLFGTGLGGVSVRF